MPFSLAYKDIMYDLRVMESICLPLSAVREDVHSLNMGLPHHVLALKRGEKPPEYGQVQGVAVVSGA